MENPFVFDRPNNINISEFIQFYIKENIYTRFLESTRNILLIGVRGSGKTSTLRYYSFPVQFANSEVEDKYSVIGIHIPSKHAIFGKREYLLYENQNKQSVVIEHFLCINIISCICETFISTPGSLDLTSDIEKKILKNLSFILESDFPTENSLFESIKLFVNKEANSSQRKLNNDDFESFIDFSFSFNNTIIPFLEQLKNIPNLENSHFSLFFDDIQDLGKIHQEIINSWISYRDNKLFSFKIATADIKPSFITSTGGVILEGHDFVKIDLTKRLYNKESEFSKFARDVIAKRLMIAKIDVSVEEFLPESESFRKGLDDGKLKARKLAAIKYPDPKGTQINDYVAKYGRAIYFRERNPKANLPIYSGFETLVDISTGVIRNLLTPAFFMYEKQLSNTNGIFVREIPSDVQKEIILNRSETFWEKIKDIDSEIENCPEELGKKINNFFNQLMIYLKKRLKNETISEPRALNFIISQIANEEEQIQIDEIINTSLKSTLLYKRMVGHKATGVKLPLYVPNRMMLPLHGLDSHGQYSHFPITGRAFLEAALQNKEIPFFADEDEATNQLELIF
ncbi:MAG: hypothetical protein H0V01_10720 [Bacteroidetes bacterium]|nr:hypothetical protein [Bacteroidota bacterium]HET6244825.1 hypothetical protein [Bacteroidia bacterium]